MATKSKATTNTEKKGRKMTLEVTLLGGKTIYPTFQPEHLEGVAAYYNEQLRIGFVKAWKVL